MPTVPNPVAPTVAPQATLNITPRAEAFGASVLGAGLQGIAKEGEDIAATLARHAEQMQAIDNKAAVDGAVVNLAQAQDLEVNNYRANNMGIAAADNLPKMFEALEKQRVEIGKTLSSPAAREMFNAQSRVMTLQSTQQLASFAAQQRKVYNVGQIEGKIKLLQSRMTPENFAEVQDAINAEIAVLATPQLIGMSKEQFLAATQESAGASAFNLVASLAPKDPAQAQEFYDAHKDKMTPQQRTQSEAYIRAAAEPRMIAGIVDETIASVVGEGGSPLEGIDQLTALGARITSGYRTPEENARVRGVKNSLHMQDRARDLVPPKGMSMAQLAAEARRVMPGAEVINEGNHVHVEWEGRAPGAIVGTNLDRLEDNLPRMLVEIEGNPLLAGRPDLQDQARARLMAQVRQLREAQTIATSSAYDRLLTAATQGNLTDPVALQNAYPGANADYAALPQASKNALIRGLTAGANAWTPERSAAYNELIGLKFNNPTAFINADLTAVDIPDSAKRGLFAQQQAVRAKQEKVLQSQASISRALGNEFVKQGLAAAKLKKDSSEYNQFTGALFAELEEWDKAHPGKRPTDKEIGEIAAGLLAKQERPATQRVFGIVRDTTIQRPDYEVPAREVEAIVSAFTAARGREPTDAEIAYIYRRGQ